MKQTQNSPALSAPSIYGSDRYFPPRDSGGPAPALSPPQADDTSPPPEAVLNVQDCARCELRHTLGPDHERISEHPALSHGVPNLYRVQTAQGQVAITEYHVFPGIWLAYKDAHTMAFENLTGSPNDLLEITHCREGRLEYEGKKRFFYIGQGDMAIHSSGKARALLRCPTGHYHGISVIIDPALAPQCASCLLRDVEVDLPALFRKFGSPEGYFVMRSTPRLAHLFSELYAVPEHLRKGYLKVKVLELLLFLSCLDPGQLQTGRCACSKGQAQLLQEVFAFIRDHRNERLTAEDLAVRFHVSPEQLRRGAKSVYGQPLYQCIRTYKMHLAAAELLRSTRTVTDIAGEFGYDNSSKFASAFQSVLGRSPAEYRADGSSATELFPYFGAKNG